MLIIVNKPTYQTMHGHSFHAFFMGENGHACVPNEWGDGLTSFEPTEFFIPNLENNLKEAKEWLKSNSACRQYKRLLAYCSANGIDAEKLLMPTE